MYTYLIQGTLKPGKKPEFLEIWRNQILPTLKQQNGFVDEILLLPDSGNEAVGLGFWNRKEEAKYYEREVFPRLSGMVKDLFQNMPVIRGYNVEASETFNIGKAA